MYKPLHMYIENNVTGFLYVALKVVLVMTLCGVLLLSMCYSTIVCNQQHQDHLCSTYLHFTFFSFDYLYMHKTPVFYIVLCVGTLSDSSAHFYPTKLCTALSFALIKMKKQSKYFYCISELVILEDSMESRNDDWQICCSLALSGATNVECCN